MNRLVLTLLAAPLCAMAQDTAATAPTEHGAKTTALVESYLKGPDGTPYPGENAWPLFARIVEATLDSYPPESSADDAVPLDHDVLYLPEVAESYRAKGKDVEAMRRKALDTTAAMAARGVFDDLSKLCTERRFIRPPQPGNMIDWNHYEIGACRSLARCNAARMLKAASSGDWASFTTAFEQSLAIGRVLAHQSNVLERLAGFAVRGLALHQARDAMCRHKVPAEVIRSLREAIERQGPYPPLALALEGERLLCLDTVRMIYGDPTKSPGQMIAQLGEIELTAEEVKRMEDRVGGLATRQESTELSNEIFDRAVSLSKLPVRDALSAAAGFRDDAKSLPDRQMLVSMLLPDVHRLVLNSMVVETDLAGTRLMLAIELFHAERKSYPASLADLVPDYISAIPSDPCSPAGFIYKHPEPDPSPDHPARPYLLYSTGYDGTDNGGVSSPEDPAAAIKPGGAGLDYVFNAGR